MGRAARLNRRSPSHWHDRGLPESSARNLSHLHLCWRAVEQFKGKRADLVQYLNEHPLTEVQMAKMLEMWDVQNPHGSDIAAIVGDSAMTHLNPRRDTSDGTPSE